MTTDPQTADVAELYLSTLLKRAVVDVGAQPVGKLGDVIVRLRDQDYPLVTGLVADLGGHRIFVDARKVTGWNSDRIALADPKIDLREFERRDGEVLLRADILGHRLVDVERARLVRAYDAQLVPTDDGLTLRALDVHRTGFLHWPGYHHRPLCRDWKVFEPLIGHEPSRRARAAFGRLGKLKPAELADLIEQANAGEQDELLAHVHADPELEADVFEELDDDRSRQLLEARSDTDVAGVLTHMRADDAADAIMGLPQDRRRVILERLPAAQQTKVRTLLGYNTATAGGLMGVDYLALPAHTPVTEALDAVCQATTLQPEALTTVYSLDPHGHLAGAVSLVGLLQADPQTTLGAVAHTDPIRIRPEADLIEITMLMADYNLLTLPVVDSHDQIIGAITVDDVLEANVLPNWRHREPAPRPPHTSDQPATPHLT